MNSNSNSKIDSNAAEKRRTRSRRRQCHQHSHSWRMALASSLLIAASYPMTDAFTMRSGGRSSNVSFLTPQITTRSTRRNGGIIRMPMANNNPMDDNNNDGTFIPPITMSYKTESDTSSDATTGTTPTTPGSESNADAPTGLVTEIEQALAEAHAMKKRAQKERLEAERMSTMLTLEKIASLEEELKKSEDNMKNSPDTDSTTTSDSTNVITGTIDVDGNVSTSSEEIKVDKKGDVIKDRIRMLKLQLASATEKPASKTKPFTTGTASSSTTAAAETAPTEENDSTTTPAPALPPMPEADLIKRTEAFKNFPKEVKSLYARAVDADEGDDIDSIVEKIYQKEQSLKLSSNDDGSTEKKSNGEIPLLDIANAQAGYSTLPPPVQEMIKEAVKMSDSTNTTAVIEKLIQANKVRPTGDFGGVEFAMGDPDEDEVDENGKSKKRGQDREFTEEEIKSAEQLFENLPAPMKMMLASSVEESESNSTAVIQKMIEEKKILPSSEGVEFVVFGDDADMIELEIEGAGYVKSMLPEVCRKPGLEPSQEQADAFFAEVLGKNTFNPTSKPEVIPGGFIIRGDNRMKTADELVAALDEKLEKSSVAGKLNFFFIKDPTRVTDEQFETDTFELPVLMLTGTDFTPETGRFVKPAITMLGGLCTASFGLAVCLSTNNVDVDVSWVESMVSPLVTSVILTQVAHEAAHQFVAWKDKFKAGAPTIIPSLQLGLQGCITPLKTSPPNFNSLFDFAIAGPMVGMIISLLLMYTGLEQQVFMDAATQSQLPSMPVELVRSSSLAGGMVEWLLGDGVLLSPDPTALVRLHPYAIAGFVGVVANALNLLPVGNTDGGRIALSVFGRSFSRVVKPITLGAMVLAGFFGGDDANLLLFFAVFVQIWQREPEIPCKNEIDTVDDKRAVAAVLTGLLVALAVIPLHI